MTRIKRHLCIAVGLVSIVLLSSCTIRPHASVGLDVNYYGGKFHVDPNVHVGVTGYP